MRLRLISMVLLTSLAALAARPHAVRRSEPLRFPLVSGGETLGEASLGWDQDAFRLDIAVRDTTPVSLAAAGVGPGEAYRADSVEFWVNRRQFVIAATPEGVRVWDYLYQEEVRGAMATHTPTEDGYRLQGRVPWAALGIEPAAGVSFQLALQINDCRRQAEGGRWKDAVRQTLFPEGATFDRPSTYGTVWLSSDAPAEAAGTLCRLATVEVRSFAYDRRVECQIRRLPPFEGAELIVQVIDAEGGIFAELPVPAGAGEQRLALPWDEARQGIYTAAVWQVEGEQRFGPLAEPYFNAGPVAIAQYRSPRQPPANLADFWARQVAAMRQRPFDAEAEPIPSPWPDTVVEKVRLVNHRGLPMVVYASRKLADTGRLPAALNVYPPMRADRPERPRGGMVGLTFCGSRQGECRLAGQTADEGLWARAESLEECYWLDVVLDGVRALDYAASRADSDGRAMVTGGSRGGWYSLALAAVAPDRVSFARFTSPCYADVTMNQRLGWSSAAAEIYAIFERDRVRTGGRVFATFRYFDPLFLAALIRTPVVFSAGLQDTICSAVGMTAAANAITYPVKVYLLDPEAGHGGSPWVGGPLSDFNLFAKDAP